MTNYIALAIPFFFTCIGLELLIASRRRRRVYRAADAMADLGAGINSQLVPVFAHASLLAAYAWVYEHHRLASLPAASPWPWLVALVAVDFLYYWWHRLSHEVNVLWAAHVVHHTSEDYNLAVALRQSVTTHATTIPFYLPLALAGIPPVVYVGALSFNTLYQFWIHTELIDRLGPVEGVINTPSAHRVHHAINGPYLDKNYAGIFMCWDRLFGTYVVEGEAPVYGTVKPLASYDPFAVQLHYWRELVVRSVSAKRWRDRIKVWYASPAWREDDQPPKLPPPDLRPETQTKYDPRPTRAATAFALFQLALATALTTAMLFCQDTWPVAFLAAAATAVVATLVSVGALSERRAWAWPLCAALLVVETAGAALLLAHRLSA